MMSVWKEEAPLAFWLLTTRASTDEHDDGYKLTSNRVTSTLHARAPLEKLLCGFSTGDPAGRLFRSLDKIAMLELQELL